MRDGYENEPVQDRKQKPFIHYGYHAFLRGRCLHYIVHVCIHVWSILAPAHTNSKLLISGSNCSIANDE